MSVGNHRKISVTEKFWLVLVVAVIVYAVCRDFKVFPTQGEFRKVILSTTMITPKGASGTTFNLAEEKDIEWCVTGNTGRLIIQRQGNVRPIFAQIEREKECKTLHLTPGEYVISLNTGAKAAKAKLEIYER